MNRRLMMAQSKYNIRHELEVNKADLKIMIWGNTWHTTTTNQTVIVGYFDAYDGKTYPIVIGATRASASVGQRYVGSSTKATANFNYNGTELYHNLPNGNYHMATGTKMWTDLPYLLHLNAVTGVDKYGLTGQTQTSVFREAAEDLLDYYLGKI